MFNLSINSEQVELSDRSRMQLSRLVFDLKDISKRGITISNSIVLPFSKKNDRLLGFPSRLNSNNDSFEVNQTYTLTIQDNIVSTGDIVIKEFDEKKGIKIQLAEGYGFWTKVSKLKLNDLDLFEFDVDFSTASFNNLSVKTDSPFLWALDLSSGDESETVFNNLLYSRPHYRYRIILSKIIEQAGFQVDYKDIFNQTKINDIGFLSHSDDFSVTDYKRHWEGVAIPKGDIDQSTGLLEFSLAGNVALSGNNLVNQLYSTSYVIKGVVNSKLKTSITVTSIGSEITTQTVSVPKGISNINFRTSELEINNNTVFSIGEDVVFENVRIYSHINESDIIEVEDTWKGNGQNSILDSFQILTDYNLPSMTQGVFFKEIIKMLFLKVDIDVLKRVVSLDSFSDVLNTNNAIDLTGKAMRFPPYSSGKSFGQLNLLSYNNDDAISNELGRASFNINNENAKPTKSFIKIEEFSASKETIVIGNTTIDVPIYTLPSATIEAARQSVGNRIVLFKTGIGIPFTATFAGIGWNVLFNSHYIKLIDSIERERVMNVSVLLSFLNFKKLRKKPIIFIGELQSYFLVLKVSGFEEGKFTKISIAKFV